MRYIFLPFLFPIILVAQDRNNSLYDSIMKAELTLNGFNGNVLVAKAGKIIFQKSYGYRNYDTKELLDSNSVFELASITKQFTAVCILQLMEAGKLKLSDSLRQYFPEMPYHNITIQQLLTHTSGLPDYSDSMGNYWNHKNIAFNNDAILFLEKEKLLANFKPDTKWQYCNTGYMLLASIVEKLSGLTFQDYLQQHIFKPLHMNHSRIYNTRRSSTEVIPDYAYGFVYSDSLKRYILPDSLPALDYVFYLDGIVGDGGVNSTTTDLYKWDRALKNHVLLREDTQNEMFSAQATVDTSLNSSYGYGEFLGQNSFGLGNYIAHSGVWPGYLNIMSRYVKDDITIIILSNNESNYHWPLYQLGYVASHKAVEVPYKHISVSLNNSSFESDFGKYMIPYVPATQFNLFEKEGKIYMRFEKDTSEFEFKPESLTKLFNAGKNDQQIEFIQNSFGTKQQVFFVDHGLKTEIVKVD
ncbi:MAG TPA: serine hydrolase domain-containing protein [Chitinophagaceae bacterium]|jgi:CubicO group peptidase (beta-lactamase class C family)|nr:serine hydrolase domain-containing protein [Chitinophagaceae bacterium]